MRYQCRDRTTYQLAGGLLESSDDCNRAREREREIERESESEVNSEGHPLAPKMSLTVRINKFQLPKPKANLLGRVEFRGKYQAQGGYFHLFNLRFFFVRVRSRASGAKVWGLKVL